MKDKLKICVNWAAACGGCDVAILDIEEKILDVAAIADIVYWPVAMDFKRKDLKAWEENSIDIGIFNGAVRTSEQEEDAEILREKCKVLIAFGSCACFGGIPGLANISDREGIFEVCYKETPSTDNPQYVTPKPYLEVDGYTLELPEFFDTVKALDQVVDVDYYMPGCPPPYERIMDAVNIMKNFAETGELPPKGTVIAAEKTLCDECDRAKNKTGERIENVYRPHEKVIDPEKCFLDQGIICLGPATRGGCGQTCINANMPCRGCFGPTAAMLDPGAEALSAIGSIVGTGEDYMPKEKIIEILKKIRDTVGTFYRFTLPVAIINRSVKEAKKEKK